MKGSGRWEIKEASPEPFSPIFVCAIIFAGVVRLVELCLGAFSRVNEIIIVWRSPQVGSFCLAEILLACGVLFTVHAIVDAFRFPCRLRQMGVVIFSVTFLAYTFWIWLFTGKMEDGTFVSDPWLPDTLSSMLGL